MRLTEIENGLLIPSQREKNPAILVMPSDTQQEVTGKSGSPVYGCVTSGGAIDEKLGKSVEIEEDEKTMTVPGSVAIRELTMTTVTLEFSEEAPQEAE